MLTNTLICVAFDSKTRKRRIQKLRAVMTKGQGRVIRHILTTANHTDPTRNLTRTTKKRRLMLRIMVYSGDFCLKSIEIVNSAAVHAMNNEITYT